MHPDAAQDVRLLASNPRPAPPAALVPPSRTSHPTIDTPRPGCPRGEWTMATEPAPAPRSPIKLNNARWVRTSLTKAGPHRISMQGTESREGPHMPR